MIRQHTKSIPHQRSGFYEYWPLAGTLTYPNNRPNPSIVLHRYNSLQDIDTLDLPDTRGNDFNLGRYELQAIRLVVVPDPHALDKLAGGEAT
jgi:hypothetical protein